MAPASAEVLCLLVAVAIRSHTRGVGNAAGGPTLARYARDMNADFAAKKKPIAVLWFVQVTPPRLRERTADNDAMLILQPSVSQQIASQILDAVASGRLAPGTPLPSHADLAKHWHVNPNTVQAVFARLRQAYAISGDRRGSFVTATPDRVRALMAAARLSSSISYALAMGIGEDSLRAKFEELLAAYTRRGGRSH